MEIEILGDKNHTTLKINGEILAETCHILREKIMEIINSNNINIILDMQNTQFIDSAGLGVLIGIKSTINKRKGTFNIINYNDRIADIFRITRMDKLFFINDKY